MIAFYDSYYTKLRSGLGPGAELRAANKHWFFGVEHFFDTLPVLVIIALQDPPIRARTWSAVRTSWVSNRNASVLSKYWGMASEFRRARKLHYPGHVPTCSCASWRRRELKPSRFPDVLAVDQPHELAGDVAVKGRRPKSVGKPRSSGAENTPSSMLEVPGIAVGAASTQ